MMGEKLKEAIDTESAKTEKKERKYLYASDVFSCQRKIGFEFQGKEALPDSPKLMRVFANGHQVHDRITSYLEKAGLLLNKEQDIPQDELNVHGRYDCIVNIGGELAVCEIKSINSRNVTEPMEHHLAQLQWYMYKTNIHRGVMIYESKQTQEVFIFEVDYDLNKVTKIENWFDETNRMVSAGITVDVPGDYKSDKYPCADCKYRQHCYPANGIGRYTSTTTTTGKGYLI